MKTVKEIYQSLENLQWMHIEKKVEACGRRDMQEFNMHLTKIRSFDIYLDAMWRLYRHQCFDDEKDGSVNDEE